MASNIDLYKQRLGYSARLNLFEIELRFPSILSAVAGADFEEDLTILTTKCVMPTAREIEEFAVAYEGGTIYLAGEKGPEPDFTFTFSNTENMALRTIFEAWIDVIQQDRTSLRVSPELYECPKLAVTLLDHTKTAIKKVELLHAFPRSCSEGLQLDRTKSAELSETTIVMKYTHHRSVAV